MFIKSMKLCLVTSLLLVGSLDADDGFDNEDEFGDDEIEIVHVKTKKSKDFTTYGAVSFSTNYGYAKTNKIRSAKISGDLNLEYKINKDFKIKSTLKAYEDFESGVNNDNDLDINEIYLQGSMTNNIDIKFGRQIVVWGKSDNIRITDSLNPMDRTAPGMVDIEDLRLGRGMMKIDYFMDEWSLSGIILQENRFSKMSEIGSDYYTPSFAMIPNEPSSNKDNQGIALNLNGNLSGQDISFYYLNQYIDNTNYKSNMLGMAYNKVINSFLFKTEIAYFDNYDSEIVDAKTDSLIGLEYNGISDGSVSLEIANKDDDIQYALRFTQSFINQTLDFTALYSGYGQNLEDGGFIRTWIDYDYDDSITLNFGVIDYKDGNNLYFKKIRNNDRIFCSLKYSF